MRPSHATTNALTPTAIVSAATGAASSSTPAPRQRDLRPVMTFGRAAASCSSQARVYGACIAARYQDAEKDMCAHEFAQFKQCVSQKLNRKW